MSTEKSTVERCCYSVEWAIYGRAVQLQARDRRRTYAQCRMEALDEFATHTRASMPYLSWDDRRVALEARLAALELDFELIGIGTRPRLTTAVR